MSDYERIYLQPECCADEYNGRMWCQDANPKECADGVSWAEYVRADLFEQLQSELEQKDRNIKNANDEANELSMECADLESQLTALREANRWIPVSERLPESESIDSECSEYFLVWIEGYGDSKAMFLDREWWTSYTAKISKPVTHWKPITKPE